MQLSDLEKWGIPRAIIEIWRERQGETLLPVQSRAVQRGLLGGKHGGCGRTSMIISAPTSSGKTFCAELAAIKALLDRRRSVMLFPLKSLAEQKWNQFRRSFGSLGISSIIVSGDHPENDRAFRRGEYHLAFAIYEKFDMLLTRNLDALGNIGLIVIDELQTVGEPGRGAVLERLITKVVASIYEPSLIGLSAVIGDNSVSSGHLARWLDATLVEETRRPVDLLRGVAAEGSFRYRSYNSGLDGSESFVAGVDDADPFAALVRQLKKSPGQALVFLKSRAETVQAALQLAASVSWRSAEAAVTLLGDEEPSYLIRSLRQAMQHGVAFHNSDLSASQRTIVEQAFCDKSIRAIVSTTTLSMGVDLPAEIVYLETVKYASGAYGEQPHLVPVTRSEFDNMTGRAGRLGHDRSNDPGRAVVLAQSELDREILWSNYIAPEDSEPIRSAMTDHGMPDWILIMIVSGLAGSRADLQRVTENTFLAAVGASAEVDADSHLPSLIEAGLLSPGDQDRLYATDLGTVAANSGLTVGQAAYYWEVLHSRIPQTERGWIALALSTPDWIPPPGVLNRHEFAAGTGRRILHDSFDGSLEELEVIAGDLEGTRQLPYRKMAALKSVGLLERWSRLTPIRELEEHFQMHLGQIVSLGETAAHLLNGLARLLEAQDPESPQLVTLRDHIFAVRRGLPATWQPMYRCLGHLLNRSDFVALKQAGLERWEELSSATDDELCELKFSNRKLQLFRELVESIKEENEMSTEAQVASRELTTPMIPMSGEPETIEIDGEYLKERYLVRINGFPVRLTGKSFKYFARLAWSRLHSDTGWVYKEDLEIGFNQARYLYRMKNEICAVFSSSWPVVENNRLGYYRLSVDPSRISINRERLTNHPDYEVRSLALGAEDSESVGHG